MPSTRRFALALLTFAAFGCAKDPGDGIVEVTYDWVLGSGCATPFDSGMQSVSQVRVTLTNGDGEVTATEACTDEPITISSVPEGNYQVLIEGLDETGDTIADNINVPADEDESVSVTEGSTTALAADLNHTPATIEFLAQVTNEDGIFQMCAASMIKSFEVEAVGQSIGNLLTGEVDYCEISGFTPVEDPERRINGLVLNRVNVAALGEGGNSVASQEFPLGAPVGAGKTVRITYNCMGDTCTGEIEFPEGGGDGGGETGGEETGGEESTGGEGESTGGESTGGGDTTGGTGGADGSTG